MYEFELKMTLPLNVMIKRGQRRKLNLLEDSDFGIINKKEIIGMAEFNKSNNKKRRNKKSKSVQGIEAKDIMRECVEYDMTKTLADSLIKADKTKRNPQEILCEYVNNHCDLKGYCVRVFTNK